jgi:hypoxanthine phosphoribosyltransferase
MMTWDRFEREIKSLSKKIEKKPSAIVAVVRGGLVPARLLARDLHVKDVYAITVRRVGEERKLTVDILEDIRGKHLLLVEDMIETGRGLILAKEHLESKGAFVKTACLYIMPMSEIEPDFYLRKVEEVVRFPWESPRAKIQEPNR